MDKIKAREQKWQKRWAREKCFVPKNEGPKYYNLIEFPYPSGAGLHVGHMLPYTGMDVMARYWRKKGFDVLYPIGFDSMGISAERYAVKRGLHPSVSVKESINQFLTDVSVMGLSINPDSIIATSDPEFVKWTQWQFIRFFKAGLAYKARRPMNWCPNCKTTFTNEELEDGRCERCKGPIEQKMKEQWNLRITKYADRLVDDLDLVDYPERVKSQQINWIGRSRGAEIDFKIGGEVLTVFTTRPDTVFGATFLVLAPERVLAGKLLGSLKNKDEVEAYIAGAVAKGKFERSDSGREKTGVILDGLCAENPFSGEKMPVFVADYVLANYGSGAIMAVPAHDRRDFDFAKKFGQKIIPVVDGAGEPFEGDGPHVNSGPLDGLDTAEAMKKALEIGARFARPATRYKLEDWGFSRQMYWGEPIPLVYCEKCGWQPVPDSELPVLQPYIKDYSPTEDGESPLARAADWVKARCPKCGGDAMRETDTMPQWAGSSWYFMRYLDPHNGDEFCESGKLRKWMPVDHYNGGMEHTTRHLIYSRFWYKALFDLGLAPTPEPYAKRTSNGLIMAADGRKMSKSLGNVAGSSDVVARAGADACRMAILFLAPWENNANWSEDALTGVQRFLKRAEALADNLGDSESAEHERLRNQLAKDVAERIENMQFNTAIAAMMEYLNAFGSNKMPRACYETLLHALDPFAPHLAEELWEKIGRDDLLVFAPFPIADESKLMRSNVAVAVSVNGRRRSEIIVEVNESKDRAEELARRSVEKYITAPVKKVIHVPGRMINFVL
ncbi:MAG: leucine--tRNA ligase [Rickettsiales bacterium]|nr:leucine--tRNA ligase [Rickettsiales bacterium]